MNLVLLMLAYVGCALLSVVIRVNYLKSVVANESLHQS